MRGLSELKPHEYQFLAEQRPQHLVHCPLPAPCFYSPTADLITERPGLSLGAQQGISGLGTAQAAGCWFERSTTTPPPVSLSLSVH